MYLLSKMMTVKTITNLCKKNENLSWASKQQREFNSPVFEG